MSSSSELRIGKSFGELHYKFGRTLDGISRTPGALTMESTYRLILGYPDVYITCTYRWRELPVAEYISSQAIQLGKRLGKNTLLVPVDGHEEEFWRDAKELIRVITDKDGETLELDDNRVYLIISSCNPQTLAEAADVPTIVCDVSELTSAEFIGFFSKLLDLFNVELESNFPGMKKAELPLSPGRALLASSAGNEGEKPAAREALRVLSEIAFVLDRMGIRFLRFQWAVQEIFRSAVCAVSANPELSEKLNRVKARFEELRKSQGPYQKKSVEASDQPVVQKTFIEEVVMGDKYVTGQAGAVGPGAHAHHMNVSQTWSEVEHSIDLQRLAAELAVVQEAMRRDAAEPKHAAAIEAVDVAREAAISGNGPKVLENLKSAGKWALDVAVKVGSDIASSAMKKALGL